MAGVCDIVPKAEYAVLGKTAYDQDFVDAAVIAGATCGHPAPKERPPELDKAPALATPVAPAPRKPPTRWQRLKGRVTGKPVAGRVDPAPTTIVLPASLPQVGQPLPDPDPPAPLVEPPVRPARSPVERLLHPDADDARS